MEPWMFGCSGAGPSGGWTAKVQAEPSDPNPVITPIWKCTCRIGRPGQSTTKRHSWHSQYLHRQKHQRNTVRISRILSLSDGVRAKGV
jgi:hypothetical protein